MQVLLGLSSVSLERDQLVAIRGGVGARVICLRGSLWVTQENAAEDQLLEMGESLVIEHPGLTVVMALDPASVRIAEPVSRKGLRDLALRWLRGDGLARPAMVA